MSTPVKMESGWREALSEEFQKPYFHTLRDFVRGEYARKKIYPSGNKVFAAFDLCPFQQVRVVILGQDPYHGPGQAHGLCFSVPEGIPLPPSLRNIYKEIGREFGHDMPEKGDLSVWATRGVFLLNATLTVRSGSAGSHQGNGWEIFTDRVISVLSGHHNGLIFMLWGSMARAKKKLIDTSRHHVLEAPHPSPLSAYRGFFGCNHFKIANEILKKRGEEPVPWWVV